MDRDSIVELNDVNGRYGDSVAIRDISLAFERSRITGVIGANGAGKSSLLNAIAGNMIKTSGEITHEGERIERLSAHQRVGKGLVLVPQGRELFPTLTTNENLALGSYAYRKDRARISANLDGVLDAFPKLRDCGTRMAGALSGGEQQMLAIGRALMTEPDVLMLDEPSTGLSPALMGTVMSSLEALRDQGLTIIVVEQVIESLLKVADRIVLLKNGSVAADWAVEEAERDEIRAAYLGSDAAVLEDA